MEIDDETLEAYARRQLAVETAIEIDAHVRRDRGLQERLTRIQNRVREEFYDRLSEWVGAEIEKQIAEARKLAQAERSDTAAGGQEGPE